MQYIRVKWIHTFADEPVLLYSELDSSGSEIRKIEVFPDESIGYASKSSRVGSTRLSTEPLPALSEIAADPQFEPSEITKDEFERIWAERVE